MSAPLKTFIIYARKDEDFKNELLMHLTGTLVESGHLSVWQDGKILPGEDWQKEIIKNLEASDLFLVLVSINMLTSEFIKKEELKRALQKEGRVVPIIIRSCSWQLNPLLSKLHGLPKNMQPVENYIRHDDAWTEVVDKIHEMVEAVWVEKEWEIVDHAAFAAAHTRTDFEDYLKKYSLHSAQAHQKITAFKIKEEENAAAQKPRIEVIEKARQRQNEELKKATFELFTETILSAAGHLGIYPEMVFIKGGTFQMGDTFNEGGDHEKTVHSVTLGDFYLGAHAVTFKEYDRFCEDTNREKPSDQGWGRDRYPVINVSWDDAQAYCQWLSKKTAKIYRLPTESEWEYAAREGGKKVRFGNGKDVANPDEINFDASKNYKQPYSIVGKFRNKTVPVGTLDCPNILGLYDLSGNVWEWCADFYLENYASKTELSGLPKDADRVLRGGSWVDYPQFCQTTHRYYELPMYHSNDIGFRVAASINK